LTVVLDTNTYRAFMDGHDEAVAIVKGADQLLMPVPVLAELRYGFSKGTRGRQNEAVLDKFLDSKRVEVLVCDEQTSFFYAQLKMQLARQGTPIPINDVWIAALTLQYGGLLYTLDRDFDHIPQLGRTS
jgi:tRNA(fMet)-specific endonuclease VapC